MAKVIDIKTGKTITNKHQAKEEFLFLLNLANEYLKEAEKLQEEYKLTFDDFKPQ